MKLCWRVYSGEKSLWTEVSRGNYQRDSDLRDNVIARPSDPSLLKGMEDVSPTS